MLIYIGITVEHYFIHGQWSLLTSNFPFMHVWLQSCRCGCVCTGWPRGHEIVCTSVSSMHMSNHEVRDLWSHEQIVNYISRGFLSFFLVWFLFFLGKENFVHSLPHTIYAYITIELKEALTIRANNSESAWKLQHFTIHRRHYMAVSDCLFSKAINTQVLLVREHNHLTEIFERLIKPVIKLMSDWFGLWKFYRIVHTL